MQALKAGDWILLDELNLASQSVLEVCAGGGRAIDCMHHIQILNLCAWFVAGLEFMPGPSCGSVRT